MTAKVFGVAPAIHHRLWDLSTCRLSDLNREMQPPMLWRGATLFTFKKLFSLNLFVVSEISF